MVIIEDTARNLPVDLARSDAPSGHILQLASRLREPKVAVQVSLFLAILAVGVFARLHFSSFLDPLEDPYQDWWISANLASTGQYWDPFSMMTHGNWLPLYHFAGAGVLLVAGIRDLEALKLVNIALSTATAGLVFYVGNLKSRAVGFAAMAFFSANFIDVVISGWSTAEALGTFLVFLGIVALLEFPVSTRRNRAIAAASLLLAVMTLYEAWAVIVLLFGYAFLVKREKSDRRGILLAALPALAFMGLYFGYVSQWGFLPALVVGQTSTDVRYQLAVGTQRPIIAILLAWWSGYLWFVAPLLFLGGAFALLRARRELGLWIVLSLWGFIVLYTALEYGNPSFRYVMISLPFLCLLAARGLERLASWTTSKNRWTRAHRNLAAPAMVIAGVLLVTATMLPPPATYWENGYAASGYMEPLVKAGAFVSTLPLPAGRILLTESPVSAYYSGYPPDRILGSRYLPGNRSAALEFLQRNVAYVVYVGVPYYPLRTLFPELQNGTSTPNFTLLYNAQGQAAGWHAVYVYQVVS